MIPRETERKFVIKCVNGDIHFGIAATQKTVKLEIRWLGYSRDVEEYIKRREKCKELQNFTQTILISWSREVDPWSRVHMNHTYTTSRLFFRLA